MDIRVFIIFSTLSIILGAIFGLYLRIYSLTEYYYEFTDKEKLYIKYTPVVYIKVIIKAIKTKDIKKLKVCLKLPLTFYVWVGLAYGLSHGDFELTFNVLDETINSYNKKEV